MSDDQLREYGLLFAGESGHIGVFEDVGGVFVVAGVGDVKSDFVQSACPAEVLFPLGKVLDGYVFGVAQAVHKGLCGFGNAFGLIEADVVAVLELGGRLIAHVFVQTASNQVVEHAVAQGGFGNGHFGEFEFFKRCHHDGQSAGEHFHAFGLEAFEFGFFDGTGFNNTVGEVAHAFVGDVGFLGQLGGDEVADGFGGAGGADGKIPTCTLHEFADALDFVAGGGDGGLEVFGGDFVLEETQAVSDAA